jgi:hypothetical protein
MSWKRRPTEFQGSSSIMATIDERSAEAEHQNHRYRGAHIPWFVHLLWISFWLFAAGYVLYYLFPAFQAEVISPP